MKTVLVLEDQDAIRRMITVLVEARGFRVEAASDGPTAMDLVARAMPAVVLLDLMVPGPFDGIEVCRRIRALAGSERTPIVVISARGDEEAKARAFAAGADRYFTKPFSAVGLLREIEALLART